MKTYAIVNKLNYKDENEQKKKIVDDVIEKINNQMILKGYREDLNSPKYVFSVGGDGTMMHSMHTYFGEESIIVGINAGNVGFLTPFEANELDSVFSLIDNPNARIEQRSILKYASKNISDFSVNELAITGNSPNEMLNFSLKIEHKGLLSSAGHYTANGVLISGPCGSTAYNMNAGGAIVDPIVKCMQIVMVAPTTLGSRPLIISKNSIIRVLVKKNARVYSDGVLIEELQEGQDVEISLIPKEVNMLVPDKWNFYSVLSKKLMWNNGRDVI